MLIPVSTGLSTRVSFVDYISDYIAETTGALAINRKRVEDLTEYLGSYLLRSILLFILKFLCCLFCLQILCWYDGVPNELYWSYLWCENCVEAIFIGLKPDSSFWVNVQVFNSAGFGPKGEDAYMTTFIYRRLSRVASPFTNMTGCSVRDTLIAFILQFL